MRIQHLREDGAVLIALGGGVGVILKGAVATKPLDLRVLHSMGPWSDATFDTATRQRYAKQLNASRVATLDMFMLANTEAAIKAWETRKANGWTPKEKKSSGRKSIGDLDKSGEVDTPANTPASPKERFEAFRSRGLAGDGDRQSQSEEFEEYEKMHGEFKAKP